MIAVILAAGSSYRMRPLTDHMPKGLLTIGGKPILGQIMENIAASGIKDVLFVVGYKEEMIKEFVRAHDHDMNVSFITNEIYASTSDSVSVYQTKPYTREQEILLIDSDQWFYPQVIDKLRQAKEPDMIAINCRDQVDEEAVKVILDGDNRVLEMGKPVDIARAVGEAVGVRKFSPQFMDQLYTVLERRIVQEGIVDQVFEYSVQEMLDNGVPLYAVDTSEWPSIEMDTPQDYERAKKLIAEYEASVHSAAKQP